MADKKISQLTAATTPLAGTEVLPIVQSGSTVKVAVSDLTAGRAISTSGVTDTSLTASKGVFTDASKKLTSTGTLGVDQGGTGTGTALTAGSVVFAGASGVYSQDNANLFWDNSNDRLGIGTNTPAYALTVKRSVGSLGISQDNIVGYTRSILYYSVPSDTTEGSGHAFYTRNGNTTDNLVLYLDNSKNVTVSAGNLVVGTADKGLADSAGNLKLAINTTSVAAQSVLSGGLTNRKGTYTAGATTPSVTGVSHLVIANSSATSITNFTGGVEGQLLFLKFNDANTTITRNNAYLAGSTNFTSATNATLVLISDGTAWFEVCRSTTNG